MHRILRMTMLLVIVFSMCALPAAAAEFTADVLMKMGGQQMTSKLYNKDVMQRIEMSTPGGQMINIVNFKTGDMVTLMPARKMYMEHKGLDDVSLKQIKVFRAGKAPANAKKLGSEKIAGYKSDIYQMTDPKGNVSKIWYAPKLQYPIKSEGKSKMGSHSMELTNIKEGGVSDSLFKIPTGYKKFEMPKGMPGGGMPGGMGGARGQ